MIRLTQITDFSAPELDVYARLTEAQLLNRHNLKEGLFIAESPKVIGRALDAGYEARSFLVEEKLLHGEALEVLQRCPGVPVYTASLEVLTRLTGYQLTRGMLCAMGRKSLPSVEELCQKARRIAVLENIMNPTNLGAIFRSAAALGMDAVLLTPGCSDPLYRRSARVSMGTVFQVPWTYLGADPDKALVGQPAAPHEPWEAGYTSRPRRTATIQLPQVSTPEPPISETPKSSMPRPTDLDHLKALGFRTAAMALRTDSVPIDDPHLMAEEKLAIILGTEGEGLAQSTIDRSDYTVLIPMSHGVDSLNVAAASAVAFWQLGNRG